MDLVVLEHSLPEHGLEAGDVGTVVHCYRDAAALEVEFMTGTGGTVAVITLDPGGVRPLEQHEILHVREIAA